MEVLLKIPDDLVDYLEYIPKDVLPNVLIQALRKSICTKSVTDTSSQVSEDLIMQLMQKLPNLNVMANSGGGNVSTERVNTEVVREVAEPVEVVAFDFGGDSGLDDFMDLLK